jgi:hypothetical protein
MKASHFVGGKEYFSRSEKKMTALDHRSWRLQKQNTQQQESESARFRAENARRTSIAVKSERRTGPSFSGRAASSTEITKNHPSKDLLCREEPARLDLAKPDPARNRGQQSC